ncbi:TlpA family protein disulfide reductase [Thalassotalea piscium]
MLKNLTLQIIFFFIVFQLLSWWKTTDMLATDALVETSLSLESTDEKNVNLVAKDKTLVLYFFAPWCTVCHASIENLQHLYEKNADIDVIAVALDYTEKKDVLNFIEQHQLTFPVAYGNEQVKQQFKVFAYPSYYVIDEHNTVKSKSVGYSTELGLYIRSL